MPNQTTYRVQCPACGEWAQLRIADQFADRHRKPVVVMFSCPNQTSEDHVVAGDDELLKLLPADVIAQTRDYRY